MEIRAAEAKVSSGTLKRYVPVFEEQTVNNDLLVHGAQNLRDYFQFQGYFDVQVDFRTTTPSPDHEQVTYTLGLGERRRVAAVNIEGNHYFKTEVIRERLYTQPAGFILPASRAIQRELCQTRLGNGRRPIQEQRISRRQNERIERRELQGQEG